MKKNIMIAVIVSLVMLTAFGVFLLVMGKNGTVIKQEQQAMDDSELGIVSLQDGHYFKRFNTQTKYTDLNITGDNVNVLLFDTADPANVYNTSVSGAVRSQLSRMQDKKSYDFDVPLIAYNPFGTNTCSLYFYFQTKDPCYLRYTVTVEDENVPDFVRTMNDSDGSGYCDHEYLITGLIPGTVNYINMELISEKGNHLKSKVYRISLPESAYGNAPHINADMGKNVDKISNGLFFCYGTGKKSIALYDNSGYLRGEIPLLGENSTPVCVNNADMLVAYSEEGIARISRSGQVLDSYPLGDYRLGSRMIYNTRGQILAIASDTRRRSVNDIILNIDMESGAVKVAADMKKILKKAYKQFDRTGDSMVEIESIEYINNNDLIINSENTSSIIKLDNIMSANPTVGYIIGSKDRWNIKGYKNKLLEKQAVEDMSDGSDTDSSGTDVSGNTNGTGNINGADTERKNILEDEAGVEPFDDMVGNAGLMYEPVAAGADDTGNTDAAVRYYIGTMNNNNGNTSVRKYLVNQDDMTYCLVSDMKVLQNEKGGSVYNTDGNYVVCQGKNNSFAEYGRDGSVLITYTLPAGAVVKNSMKNFWFR